MLKNTIPTLVAFVLALTACSEPAPASSPLALELAPGLATQVEITNEEWRQPAANGNVVEVAVRVRNTSSDTVVFHVVGAWSAASGARRGGQSAEYTVFADQDIEVVLGTRSPDVTKLSLSLNQGPVPQRAAAAPVPAPATCGHTPTASSRLAMRGVVGQRPFVPGSVTFVHDQRDDSWWVEFSDGQIDELVDIAIWQDRRQTLHLELDHEPAANAAFEHTFGHGGSFFQVLETDDAARTTSWNTANAWKLVIERWDFDSSAVGDNQAGTASGRIEVCYPGSGGIPTASLVGAFEGARIFVIRSE